jgi:hypothetical protein
MHMTTNNSVSRRSVLRAVGASVAASVGAAGSGAAAPGCVVTTTRANAYNDCPGSNHVWYVEEGTNGFIERTCFDGVNNWHEVRWDCGDIWTVHEDDVVEDDACYC